MNLQITIEVTQENKVCAKCCSRGHSKNETSCRYYTVDMPDHYKTKCSRCNQPGHKRNNRSKCSLLQQYPDYVYRSTRHVQEQRTQPEILPQPEIESFEPNQILELNTRIEELKGCIERLIWVINRMDQDLINRADPDQYRQIMTNIVLIPDWVTVDEFANYIINEITITYTSELNNVLRILSRYPSRLNFWVFQLKLSNISRSLYSYITSLLLNHEVLINYVVRNVNFPSATERIIQAPRINLNVIKSEKTINETSIECSICYEDINFINVGKFNCNHKLCVTCICGIIITRKNTNTTINCPICRLNITTVKCNGDQQIQKINDCLN